MKSPHKHRSYLAFIVISIFFSCEKKVEFNYIFPNQNLKDFTINDALIFEQRHNSIEEKDSVFLSVEFNLGDPASPNIKNIKHKLFRKNDLNSILTSDYYFDKSDSLVKAIILTWTVKNIDTPIAENYRDYQLKYDKLEQNIIAVFGKPFTSYNSASSFSSSWKTNDLRIHLATDYRNYKRTAEVRLSIWTP